MNDDAIKNLFDNYNPRLSSDSRFMAQLEWKIRAVDHLETMMQSRRKTRRTSLIISAAAGFIFGMISTLCYPLLAEWINEISVSTSWHLLAAMLSAYGDVAICSSICLVTITAMATAYEITSARILRKARCGSWRERTFPEVFP